MSILNITDYKVILAERICYEKFDNDLMLIFNNFSKKAVESIIDIVKKDVLDIENKGVLLDYKLINVYCTMYLSLAWSMYRKGKLIQRNEYLIDNQFINKHKSININGIIAELNKNNECIQVIKEISIRYFTLYFEKYLKDMLLRMEVGYHPEIENEKELKNLIIEKLNEFAIKALAIGIKDEYDK